MGCYAGNTDSYLSQSDETTIKESVRKYRLWSLSKEGDPGRTPALDLNFAENKSLVDDISGSNLITFTRSSAATYVGADGLIKTAGLNFARNSESLNSWTNNGNAILISADSATAPDGTLTADVLSQTAVTAASRWVSSRTATYTAGVTYTLSIWLKKISGTDSQPTINLWVNTGTTQSVGTITTEWVRYSKSFTPVSTISSQTFTGLNMGWNDQGGANNFTFAAWGFQVEVGSSATEYAKTTSTDNSAPRFDHDPDTGESLGLLIEEERTNLIPESEDITGAGGWAGYGAGEWSITDNAATAPDGTNTAERWLASSSNGEKSAYWNARITATTVTQSIFVKPIGEQYAGLRIYYDTNDIVHITFDLTGDGSVTDTQTGSSSLFTDISSGIQSYPNGWYRIHATSTQPSRGSFLMVFNGVVSATPTLSASGSENYAGDGTTGYYLWGAQLEEGAFPTSYIPTSGATATRAPDIVDITGTNFSSWYNQSEGTVFSKYGPFNSPSSGINPGVFHFNSTDANSNECIDYFNGSVVSPVFRVRNSAVNEVYTTGGGTIDKDVQSTAASAYKVNDFARSFNGNSVITDTSGLLPSVTPTFVNIGSLNKFGITPLNGSIARLTYWTQRLQNSTLQSITQ